MKRTRVSNGFFIFRLFAVAVIMLSIVITGRMIGTENGRLFIANKVLDSIQRDGKKYVELDQLSWPQLRIFSIGRLRIYDSSGVWLEIEHAQANLGLRGLLHKNILATSLSAEQVVMSRLPKYTGSKKSKSKSGGWMYDVRQLDIHQFETPKDVTWIPMSGDLHGSVLIQPSADGVVLITNSTLNIREEKLVVDTDFSWNHEWFRTSNLVIHVHNAGITGSGIYHRDTRSADAALFSKQVDLNWLGSFFGVEAGGVAGGSIYLNYSKAYGTKLRWALSGHDIQHAAIRIEDLATTGNYIIQTNGVRMLDHMECEVENIQSGKWTIDRVITTAAALSNLVQITSAVSVKQLKDSHIESRITIERQSPYWLIKILSMDGTLLDLPFSFSSPASFQWSSNQWAVTVGPVSKNGASLNASVRYDNGFSSRGYLRNFDLSLIPAVQKSDYCALMFTEWRIGNIPHQAEGHINIRLTDIQSDNRSASPHIPSDVRAFIQLGAAAITFDGHTHGSTNVSVLLHSIIPCRWTKSSPWLEIQTEKDAQTILRANGDLARLTGNIIPDWEHLSGQLNASLSGLGPLTRPAITGFITLTNGFFEDVIRGVIFRDIQVHAESTKPDTYQLMASARDDHRGGLTLTGTYARVDQGDFVLSAGAVVTNFIAGRLLTTDIPIDGRLLLAGTGTTARLSGNVEANAITIRLPRQLPPSIRTIKVTDIREQEMAAGPSNGSRKKNIPITIDTDIRIRANSGVRINGNQLRSEWRGQGRVSGQVPDIRFGGNVEIISGSFMFLGRQFYISRGEVVIPSGKSSSPIIFITADTRAAGASIQLNVEGPASEPNIKLTSDPPLEKNEIVARLLFGKSSDTVSPLQIAYLAYALDVMDGGGPLLQKLDQGDVILGLDQLDVKQSEEESGISAVTFGKRLHDRFYLEGEVGLKNEPDVLALETEVTPHLFLRTETSPRIREGISLNWRKDY